MKLGLIGWTLEVSSCPSQLAQEEGLKRRVVEEEGAGGHAVLGGAPVLTAGPLAEHPRAQRAWKQIRWTVVRAEQNRGFIHYSDD